jgi:hypothetical protein
MKKILDIRHFIILILIGITIFLKTNNKPIIKEVIKELPGKVVHDTIPQEVPVYIEGEDIYHDKIIYVTTLVNVDTLEILKEFYAKNMHLDTIKLNNNQGYVYLTDSISQNNIFSRKWSATIKPKIVRETLPEPPKVRNQVYIGLNGAWSEKDWVNSLGTSVLFKTKSDKIFQVGIGVANRTFDGSSGKFIPFINGGAYWKIKFKKD